MGSEKDKITEITARYEEMLENQKDIINSLKEQNKELVAENKQYRDREKKIIDALLKSQQSYDEIKEVAQKTSLNEYNRLQLIAHKCERIVSRILNKYPNDEEMERFISFTNKLNQIFIRIEDENYREATLLKEGSLQAIEIECSKLESQKIINNLENEKQDSNTVFDMNAVLNPDKSKLDLQELCKELGVSD